MKLILLLLLCQPAAAREGIAWQHAVNHAARHAASHTASHDTTIQKASHDTTIENDAGHRIVIDDQLENEAARGHTLPDETGPDRRHKLSLNTADAAALQSLGILTPVQLQNFLKYRQQLGALRSIYELQAVPGFDQPLIEQLLPYVTTGDDALPHYTLKEGLHKGTNTFLYRYSRQLENSRGYNVTDTSAAHYLGSPGQLLLRYRYNFPRYCSAGILMEKDAGERFTKTGFDFYSAHLFISNYHHLKALAIGDFTVNMGQGLLNWQAFSFGKGSAVVQVNKEGVLLRPYTSSGETLFYRGAGITIQYKRTQYTAFISSRALDANADSTAITTISNTGYHRSLTELNNRHILQQFTAGGNFSIITTNGHVGINILQHYFSKPLQQKTAPYIQFTFAGKRLLNISADYAFTIRNSYLFGEAAISDNHKIALLQGILCSVAKQADLVILYRYYDKAYQSIYPNAFGENEKAANENGLYTGIHLKLTTHLKLEAYADLFRFPWLQYRLASPGTGREYAATLTYTPDKHTSLLCRYRASLKQQDQTGDDHFIQPAAWVKQQSVRCQATLQPAINISLKMRLELNACDKQRGFLLLTETGTRFKQWRLSLRYTRFVTDDTNTSMYTLSTAGGNTVSQLYGNGTQYQCNIRKQVRKNWQISLFVQQTIYLDTNTTGSGWDEINGNKKTSLQCALQHLF